MGNFSFNVAKSVLSKLSLWLGQIDYFVKERNFAINQKLKTSNVGNLHAKAAEVINEAKKHSENPAFKCSENPIFEQKERDFVYCHYLTKHYTAVFESYFETIPPIQIFNESRMALDHIVRAKEKDSTENMGKAADHALRALLDILKLNCVGLRRKILKEHKKYPSRVLGLVSNGDYIKKFAELQNKAEAYMFKAKRGDYNLDESGCRKIEVASDFIHAFDAHDEWLQHQREHWSKIIAVYVKSRMISVGSFLFGIITSVIAGIITYYICGSKIELIERLWMK